MLRLIIRFGVLTNPFYESALKIAGYAAIFRAIL